MTKLTWLVVATSLLCLACAPKADPNAPLAAKPEVSSQSNGSKLFKVKGFQISLPKDWETLDVSQGDFDKAMDDIAGRSPVLKANLAAVKSVTQSGAGKLFAFDVKATQAGFTPNLNVLELPLPANTSIAQLLEANKAQAQTLGTVKRSSELQIGGKPAGVVEFEMSLASNATGKQSSIAYIVPIDSKQLVFTFSTMVSDADRMRSIADTAMKTVKF